MKKPIVLGAETGQGYHRWLNETLPAEIVITSVVELHGAIQSCPWLKEVAG